MLPKEHGAWNALLVVLFAGWIALGRWEASALAASFFWLSSFALRAPVMTAWQYRRVDRRRFTQAVFFSFFLLTVIIASGFFFAVGAPSPAFRCALGGATPCVLFFIVWLSRRKALRTLSAEMVGFAGLCLLAPVLYLCSPQAVISKAWTLYLLFLGYFLPAISYVRLRREWLWRFRSDPKKTPKRKEGWLVLLFHGLAVLIWLLPPGGPRILVLGPLYALMRVFAGVLGGDFSMPLMKLGVREMIHSLVFLTLSMAVWSIN